MIGTLILKFDCLTLIKMDFSNEVFSKISIINVEFEMDPI